ncbi:MAG: 3-deoxy-7-phosphoheptulonate synthase [Pseudomonadota bacterium]|nr:3-deoxy-7-phosphoheptulonate synthase [Pseudomonadota bacterium]|tara:strand:- start:146 stop:1201 length:1056 start_codon:yes stop_codon:yes gene_type:complete
MDYLTDNTRIIERHDLITPIELIEKYPISNDVAKLIYGTRNEISNILHGKDDRLLIVCGPCSIHDEESALEYAEKLKSENFKHQENLLIVMRVYFEKPRTTVGWKGLINDPDLNNSFDANKGLELARSILKKISEIGLPVGTEFLDPISPQYVADLISWGAIGARTAESQIHRELASGLSCPIGIKNGTTGALKPAIDGIQAANHPHVFFSTTKEGKVQIYKTSGNSDTHIILRGGVNPNFDENAVKNVITALTEAEVNESIMIDNSHGNSQKQPKKQIDVTTNVCGQIASGNRFIRGIMLESHLNEGNQKISENLNYGQSITDACMGWEDSVSCLAKYSEAVSERRNQEN